MALFQRRPQTSDPVNYVSVGLNKTILFIGLGNVGDQYAGTRHNIGFACLDEFVSKSAEMGSWILKKDLKCYLSSGQIGQSRVIAVKPTTMMNLSGEAAAAVSGFYKITPDHVLAIHDELDIDFGQIRTRLGGSAAGHNGIKSLTNYLGEDFGRLRIGIGPQVPEQIDSAVFVLQKFGAEQKARLPALTKETYVILNEYIYGGQLAAETRQF